MEPIVAEEVAVEGVVTQEQQSVIEELPPQTDVTITRASTYEQIDGVRQYPSLYDTYGSTMIAIVFAVAIVTAVIGIVQYIYRKAASDHSALTQFVTTMFALIAGIFVADKIVAGPSTQLLHGQESLKILEFIQQTCLMVFAYYFGTKAQPPKDGPLHKEE
jgi:hypothetical protein